MLAVPPILTNAYVAVDEVEPDAVEAAGDGDEPRQILRRVELPLALPLLFAGIRTAAVFVGRDRDDRRDRGGGGLGDIIVNQASYGIEDSSARRSASRCSRSPPTRGSALVQRVLTPAGLKQGDSGVGAGCAPGRLTG